MKKMKVMMARAIRKKISTKILMQTMEMKMIAKWKTNQKTKKMRNLNSEKMTKVKMRMKL